MLAEKLLKPPSTVVNYIEDVFSTWLTSGTGASQTVVNGNNLATNGGLIWEKLRGPGTQSNSLTITDLGLNKQLNTDSSGTGTSATSCITALNTDGFTFGTAYSNLGDTNVFWTFLKKKNFYTTATWNGNGSTQNIAHDLGSTPGCIMVKNITTNGSWIVWHRGLSSGYYISLNSTGPQDYLNAARRFGNNTTTVNPTSTQFTVGDLINTSGDTWVALIFGHNAGGFGLNGTDNVISCGVYQGNGTNPGPVINEGYEPQLLIVKNITSSFDWLMYDTMRGMPSSDVNTGATKILRPNTTGAESGGGTISPTATGFQINTTYAGVNTLGENYIYILVRRGPMKVPTDATKVFYPETHTSPSTSGSSSITTGFPLDLNLIGVRNTASYYKFWATSRLRVSNGTTNSNSFATSQTFAENTYNGYATFNFDNNTGYKIADTNGSWNGVTTSDIVVSWNLKRAPSFFDEICYIGTGLSGQTFNHNLTVPPELWIIKSRSNGSFDWYVGSTLMTNSEYVRLNFTDPKASSTSLWNSTYPSSTVITFGYAGGVNGGGVTYDGWLFASCPGVSKVFTFNGNGSTQTINCGFSGGARLVFFKAINSSGGWYIYDTARGMTASTDPYLFLNSMATEVATLGSVTTVTTGFAVNESVVTGVNTSGVTYLGFAIA